MANVDSRLIDLAEVAAFVYAADQAVTRTGITTFDYGTRWIRQFRFEIAVRCPDFWNQLKVKECLTETLGFLTEDSYEFGFAEVKAAAPFDTFLEFGDSNPEGVEHVSLFSGGLDSLAGAVEAAFHHERKVALISHKPVSHVGARQTCLVSKLKQRVRNKALVPQHHTVVANKSGTLDHDHTQRSRSFLFCAIGTVIARIYGLSALNLYENGVISINLPLCGQEVNARASRTTHPQALHRLSQLLRLICDGAFTVTNHFLDLTKQDVVERIKECEQEDLIRDTISCSHTRQYRTQQPHCGLCAQCLSRRFATLGADVENHDPNSDYRVDPLIGERTETRDRTLAERFVGVARQIEKMQSAIPFQQAYANDLARASPYLEGSNRDAVCRLFDLHHRHAMQVGDVLGRAMSLCASDYRQELLPDTCTLHFAFQLGQRASNVESPADRIRGETAEQIERLKEMERNIIIALYENGACDPTAKVLPCQQQIAVWAGYEPDSNFRTAMSALGKARLVLTAKELRRRKGCCLTERGWLAGELLSSADMS